MTKNLYIGAIFLQFIVIISLIIENYQLARQNEEMH